MGPHPSLAGPAPRKIRDPSTILKGSASGVRPSEHSQVQFRGRAISPKAPRGPGDAGSGDSGQQGDVVSWAACCRPGALTGRSGLRKRQVCRHGLLRNRSLSGGPSGYIPESCYKVIVSLGAVEFAQGGGELGGGHRLAQGGHLGVGPDIAALVERVCGVAREPAPFDQVNGSRLTILTNKFT